MQCNVISVRITKSLDNQDYICTLSQSCKKEKKNGTVMNIGLEK